MPRSGLPHLVYNIHSHFDGLEICASVLTASFAAPQEATDTIIAEQNTNTAESPGVRFASNVEEITPVLPEASTSPVERDESSAFTEVTCDQIKALSKCLHGRPLQERRMNICHHFETFSLPPSRVRSCAPPLHTCFLPRRSPCAGS